MKRIVPFSEMRWPMLLLVSLAGGSAPVGAHERIGEPDSLRVELNPRDYAPLAVGNRWTYEHLIGMSCFSTPGTPGSPWTT